MPVVMFAGQGSQRQGMGEDLFDRFPEHMAISDEVLGWSVRDVCLNDFGRLSHTEYAQPALPRRVLCAARGGSLRLPYGARTGGRPRAVDGPERRRSHGGGGRSRRGGGARRDRGLARRWAVGGELQFTGADGDFGCRGFRQGSPGALPGRGCTRVLSRALQAGIVSYFALDGGVGNAMSVGLAG